MKHRAKRAAALLSFVTLCLHCVPSHGADLDVVRMKNGDVVSGEILKFDNEELSIDPDFTDEIIIELEHIESIETSRAMTVEYPDGSEKTGYIVLAPDGRMLLQDEPPAKPEEEPEVAKPIEPLPGEIPPSATVIDLAAVDSIEQVEPYYRYTAGIDLGANSSSGNTDATNLNFSAAFIPSFGKNTIDLSGQLNRGKADGDLNTSNWRINGQYEREFWRKWFGFIVNTYEYDKFQDLDLRISAGSGLGYKFFEPDPTLLRVALAPAYVNEMFSDDDDRQYAAALWSTDFDQDLWHPDVSLYHNHRLTVGLSESQFLALTVQGLKFDLIDDFNLKLEFQFDHNNEPADDAKQNDYRYLVKLGYDFEGDENDWFQ